MPVEGSKYRWITPSRRGPWLDSAEDAGKSAKLAGVAHRDEAGKIFLDALTWIEERKPSARTEVRGRFVDRRMKHRFDEDYLMRGSPGALAGDVFDQPLRWRA